MNAALVGLTVAVGAGALAIGAGLTALPAHRRVLVGVLSAVMSVGGIVAAVAVLAGEALVVDLPGSCPWRACAWSWTRWVRCSCSSPG